MLSIQLASFFRSHFPLLLLELPETYLFSAPGLGICYAGDR
jgi:hypothetical protein